MAGTADAGVRAGARGGGGGGGDSEGPLVTNLYTIATSTSPRQLSVLMRSVAHLKNCPPGRQTSRERARLGLISATGLKFQV